MNYILDIAIIAVITIAVIVSWKKGFVKASHTILSIIISILLITALQAPLADYLESSPLGDFFRSKVSEQVLNAADTNSEAIEDKEGEGIAVVLGEKMGLPSFVMDFLGDEAEEGLVKAKDNATDFLTNVITEVILKILSFVLLLLAVRLAVFFILRSAEIIVKLPVLSAINSLLGFLVGAVNGLLAVYIICALLMLFSSNEALADLGSIVNQTFVFKYFYNNNLLLGLFI